jgi:hypothetical protein
MAALFALASSSSFLKNRLGYEQTILDQPSAGAKGWSKALDGNPSCCITCFGLAPVGPSPFHLFGYS